MMTSTIKDRAVSLLAKCRDCGIITAEDDHDLIYADLVESGIVDSMSLTMLSALLEDEYQFVVNPSQFVLEMRSLNAIVETMERHREF
jgi:acyl carrier protein